MGMPRSSVVSMMKDKDGLDFGEVRSSIDDPKFSLNDSRPASALRLPARSSVSKVWRKGRANRRKRCAGHQRRGRKTVRKVGRIPDTAAPPLPPDLDEHGDPTTRDRCQRSGRRTLSTFLARNGCRARCVSPPVGARARIHAGDADRPAAQDTAVATFGAADRAWRRSLA